MFSRRGILGLLSSVVAYFVAKPKLAISEVSAGVQAYAPNGFVARPDWCPEGWLPIMGQTICKEQFPFLFTQRSPARKGRTILPKYYGEDKVVLPKQWPDIPNEIQAQGWQDGLTRTQPLGDVAIVHVMATEPQKWSNGTWAGAGFTAATVIAKATFEQTYGPIPEEKNWVAGVAKGYDGYEPIKIS